MADIIQIRRDTAANWTSVNPVLAQGEMGFETDTEKMKLGDGATNWNSLNYFITTQGSVAITGGTIDDAVIGSSTPAAATFTDLESNNVRLTVYSLTGTDIDPANGGIQYKTLAANTTFTESMADGESVMIRISGGDTYTVTWPTMLWVTSSGNAEPTLTGSDVVVLWQESSTVYGAYVGSYA